MRSHISLALLALSLFACAPAKSPSSSGASAPAGSPSSVPDTAAPPQTELAPAVIPFVEEPPPPPGRLAAGLIGAEGPRTLNEADRQAMEQAAKNALDNAPTNRGVSWRNPATGNSGSITPVRSFQDARRDYCRDFQQVIAAGGQTRQGKGTACRRGDGSWQVVQ